MKRFLFAPAALILILSLVLTLVSCSADGRSDGNGSSTTAEEQPSEVTSQTTRKKYNSKPFPPIEVDKYDYTPPLMGEEFDRLHNSYRPVDIIHADCDDIVLYSDGADTVGEIFGIYDKIDISSNAALGNSRFDFIGYVDGVCTVVLTVPDGCAVSAYSLVTGYHEEGFQSPDAWTVYGSNIPPSQAKRGDWVELDIVTWSNIDVFAPYGYTIDRDKVDTYKYYKFEFWYGYGEELYSIYLESLFLYADPEE